MNEGHLDLTKMAIDFLLQAQEKMNAKQDYITETARARILIELAHAYAMVSIAQSMRGENTDAEHGD